MSISEIKQSLKAFEKLTGYEYVMVLGRKGKKTEVILKFEKDNYYHLAGLHYLKDRPNLNIKRALVFDRLLDGRIKEENILSSEYYGIIRSRVKLVRNIRVILNSGDFRVFTFDTKKNKYTNIKADILIKAADKDSTINLFLSREKDGTFRCSSIFYEGTNDYSLNQSRMVLLEYAWKIVQ